MAFTSKVSNIIKGAVGNLVGQSISSAVNNFVAGGAQRKKLAAKLINKSPLEIQNIDPKAHMTVNPYEYGFVAYPEETMNLGEGHFIIFDVLMHKSSKFKDQGTNPNARQISGFYDAELEDEFYVGENNTQNQTLAKLKKKGLNFADRQIKVNSGLNEKTPTHTFLSDSIILYTPGQALKFGYGASYNDASTGIAGLLGNALTGVVNAGSVKDAASALVSAAKDSGGDAAAIFARSALFGAASLIPGFEGAEAAFDKAKGQAVNPQMELVFQSVPFRTFNFPFEFAPKNKKEKDEMHKIINLFKFHMHPEYQSTTRGYFNVPSEFQITYMYRENINSYIPRISRCVLKNMNVDYAPEGVFSTFKADNKGAPPVLAKVDLEFQETEIMTKETIAAGM